MHVCSGEGAGPHSVTWDVSHREARAEEAGAVSLPAKKPLQKGLPGAQPPVLGKAENIPWEGTRQWKSAAGTKQLARPDRPRVPRCREWRGLAPWGREGLSRQTRPGRGVPGVGSGAWWRWGQAAQPLRVCSFNVEKRHLVHFIEEALRPNTVPPTALTFSPPCPHFHQPPVQGRTGLLSTQMFAVFLKKEMLVSRYISSLKLEA